MADKHRIHVERMLKRAIRRRVQADRLVTKWTKCLAEINRESTAERQAQLWNEEDIRPEPDDNSGHGLVV